MKSKKVFLALLIFIISFQSLLASSTTNELMCIVGKTTNNSITVLCVGEANTSIKLNVNDNVYTLYLNQYGNCEYTINKLLPNTQYKISFTNNQEVSNQVTATTRKNDSLLISEAIQTDGSSVGVGVVSFGNVGSVLWYINDVLCAETFSYHSIAKGLKKGETYKISVKSNKENNYYDDTVHVTIK